MLNELKNKLDSAGLLKYLISEQSKLIKLQKTGSFSAEEFNKAHCKLKDEVEAFQLEHGISGIAWEELFYNGHLLIAPDAENNLLLMPGDKEALIAATPSVLAWWEKVTEGMTLWMTGEDDTYAKVQQRTITAHYPLAEWASIWILDSPDCNVTDVSTGESWTTPQFEIHLSLCWGNPKEVPYISFPESDSLCFTAVPKCYR